MSGKKTFCISQEEYIKFGCPHCGCLWGYFVMVYQKTGLWKCLNSKCRGKCHVLGADLNVSSIREGKMRPKLERHPRYGIPGWSPKLDS